MVVVGKYASIISNTGSTYDVGPFTPDCVEFQNLPILDAAMITQRYKPRIQNIITTILIFAVIISEYLYHWFFSSYFPMSNPSNNILDELY